MFYFIIMILLSMFISIVMILLNMILSKKMWQDREKLTPFECGFDPITSARVPFSINFFLISLIFLIFDIEIMLLIPMILSIHKLTSNWIITSLLIILILILGIYLEWNENSIKWI